MTDKYLDIARNLQQGLWTHRLASAGCVAKTTARGSSLQTPASWLTEYIMTNGSKLLICSVVIIEDVIIIAIVYSFSSVNDASWSSLNSYVISQAVLLICHGDFSAGRRPFWCYHFHQQIHRARCQWDALQSGQCHQISPQPEHCPQRYQAREPTGKWIFSFLYCWILESVWEKVCACPSLHTHAKLISPF